MNEELEEKLLTDMERILLPEFSLHTAPMLGALARKLEATAGAQLWLTHARVLRKPASSPTWSTTTSAIQKWCE